MDNTNPQLTGKKRKLLTKLRKILRRRNMKQIELIAILNHMGYSATPAKISELINGKKDFFVYETLVPLCKALECTPNDLIEGNWSYRERRGRPPSNA